MQEALKKIKEEEERLKAEEEEKIRKEEEAEMQRLEAVMFLFPGAQLNIEQSKSPQNTGFSLL